MPASQKKRNKPYKRKPIKPPMIVGAGLVMAPLHAIINQIETDGTVTCSPKGVAMFQEPVSGQWCDTSYAVAGLADFFEMYGIRHKMDVPVNALREFQKALEYVMPISASLLSRLKADIGTLQAIMAKADQKDAIDLLGQAMIKDELQKAGVGKAGI